MRWGGDEIGRHTLTVSKYVHSESICSNSSTPASYNSTSNFTCLLVDAIVYGGNFKISILNSKSDLRLPVDLMNTIEIYCIYCSYLDGLINEMGPMKIARIHGGCPNGIHGFNQVEEYTRLHFASMMFCSTHNIQS